MSIWSSYSKEQKEMYVQYLKIYGALSNLFRQKESSLIPHLDSKYQETVYTRSFDSKIVDIGNTPHDVLAKVGGKRVGIGLKTWMNTSDSFQKVMQVKSYREEIDKSISTNKPEIIAHTISKLKNDRMVQDYKRLGLEESSNVYHYVTRDENKMVLQETAYPLIDLGNLRDFNMDRSTSFTWSDGIKEYRYSYADSQIWQKFSTSYVDTKIIDKIDIAIMNDPFKFLLDAYLNLSSEFEIEEKDYEVAYLPMYSYTTKEVQNKAGLNAWNAASKTKGSDIKRPDREIYIPIPMKFHKMHPHFFTEDSMMNIIDQRSKIKNYNRGKESEDRIEYPDVRFNIILPDGKTFPGLVTADNMKQLQSGGYLDGDAYRYGQSELGNWLLNEVLNLDPREKVTKEWLTKKGTDSIKLWRKKGDYENIYIDFAPVGSFEMFMEGKDPIALEDDELLW